MKSAFLTVIAIVGSLLSASAAADLIRIMPLGDSLTASSPGYRGPLFQMLSDAGYKAAFVGTQTSDPQQVASPKHEGHGGFTIGPGKSKGDAWTNGKGNIFDNLDEWLQLKPDIILLLIGTNEYFNIGDLQPGYAPDKQGASKLGALLDKIHQISPKSRVLVSSILPVAWDQNFAEPFNSAIPALVASRPYASFADLNRTAGFQDGDWSADKLHPSEQGYQKMAKAWFAALKPLLSSPH